MTDRMFEPTVAEQYIERFGHRPDSRMLTEDQQNSLRRRMQGSLATGRPLMPRDFGLDFDTWEEAAPAERGVVF